MNTELVSVVIPCYNYGRFIEETIQSVLNSTYKQLEIIIVDDGSTDQETIEVLARLEEYSNLTLIRQANKGVSAARNVGISCSKGKYILPLDADDLIDDSLIEKAVWILENNTNIDFVYSDVRLFGLEESVWNTHTFSKSRVFFHNIAPVSCVFRRHCFENIAGYDESMKVGYEDWDLMIRLVANGYRGYRIKQPLLLYRKHGPSLSPSTEKHKEFVKMFRQKYRDNYNWKVVLGYLGTKIKDRIRKSKSEMIEQLIGSKIYSVTRILFSKIMIKNLQKPISIFEDIKIPKTLNVDRRKVLVILPFLETGGVESTTFNLIESMKDEFEFHVITTDKSKHPWDNHYRSVCRVTHLYGFLNSDDKKANYILKIIAANKYGVVHLTNSRTGYRALQIIKKCTPIKTIDVLHMEEPYEPWDFFRFSQFFKNYIDKRVVLTKSQYQRLVDHYKENSDKIITIPNGVPIQEECITKEISKKQIIISFIGRLTKQKNPLLVIDIAESLMTYGDLFKIRIYGDGPLKKRVVNKVKKSSLANLEYMGKAQSGIEALMETDILLAPSLVEGLPMVGLEAMSLGIPIVASNTSGWNDLVGTTQCGKLCSLIDEYVQAIGNLADPDLRELLGEKGKTAVKNVYNMEVVANKYRELYLSK